MVFCLRMFRGAFRAQRLFELAGNPHNFEIIAMKYIKWQGFVVLLALIFGSTVIASARTWTDKTGKYRIVADYVSHDTKEVKIRKESKEIVTVPLSRLCAADRTYLAKKSAAARSAKPKPSGDTQAAPSVCPTSSEASSAPTGSRPPGSGIGRRRWPRRRLPHPVHPRSPSDGPQAVARAPAPSRAVLPGSRLTA